jgi:hypothetical protein
MFMQGQINSSNEHSKSVSFGSVAPNSVAPNLVSPDEHRAGNLLLSVSIVLTLLFHGALLVDQSFARTYDALVHIFFASHYAKDWFDPWEPRWYTGFLTISYPPLVHQLIALLSKLVGLKAAYGIVQMVALLGLNVGTYRFSRLLFTPRASGYASLIVVISSALIEAVHVFGQLPTTLALAGLLNMIPFALDYVRSGRLTQLIRSAAWAGATTAAHHVTTIFGSVFFIAPMLLIAWLEAFRAPRPLEPVEWWPRLLYRVVPRTYRIVLLVLVIACSLLVVFPFWIWSRSDPIAQVSIPHGSRDNFLENGSAGLMFFLIPWATALAFLPYALQDFFLVSMAVLEFGWSRLRKARGDSVRAGKSITLRWRHGLQSWRWPISASVALLFALGLGGTTPFARLILRGAFEVLTLERFTLWATVLTTPFMGAALESLFHGTGRTWLDLNLGRRVRLGLSAGLVLVLVGAAIFVSSMTRLQKFQPEQIEIAPITAFIEKDEHWRYRYLTLGFGDQMAWLSANTRGLTPDGNYHSARRLVELTSSPIERLDGAKYTGPPGLGSLEQFLSTPEKFHLKYVFSNDQFYDPLLFFSGWHQLGRLENGIQVWEREDVPPLPNRLPRRTLPLFERVAWGTLPPLAFLAALGSLVLVSRRPKARAWQRNGLGARALDLLREDAIEPAKPGSFEAGARLPLLPRFVKLSALFGRSSTAIPAEPDFEMNFESELEQDFGPSLQEEFAYFSQFEWPPNLEPEPANLSNLSPNTGISNTGEPTSDSVTELFVPQRSPLKTRLIRTFWLAAGVGAIGLVIALIWVVTRPAEAAEYTVKQYWNDVSFRRYNLAFERIQPRGGLTLERYLLDLSVRGGLRSGYAKLDTIQSTVIAQDEKRALIRSELSWITSLHRLQEEVTQELERTKDGWRIVAEPLLKPRSRDRFSEQVEVSYYRAPRRLTTGITDSNDLLDRPQLALIGSRLVTREIQVEQPRPTVSTLPPKTIPERVYSVVGELQNIDARPADITVTAVLRDAGGLEVRRNNAATAIIHKLLPGERTPFRIDFVGSNAPDNLEDVSNFEVFARAVVTQRNLERSLGSWTRQEAGGLRASVFNVGTHEVTIPRALVSLYDAKGIAWVEERDLIEALPPRDVVSTTLPDRLPKGYAVRQDRMRGSDAGRVFDSDLKTRGEVLSARLNSSGLNSYRVQWLGFEAKP